MPETTPFTGREQELDVFRKHLEEPAGQVILVIGHQGMGKSQLMKHMEKIVSKRPKSTPVSYTIIKTDTPDTIIEILLQDIKEASQKRAGLFDLKGQQDKIRTLINQLNLTAGPLQVNVGELVNSLTGQPGEFDRDKLIKALHLLSERMNVQERFVIFIDPRTNMAGDSSEPFLTLAEKLPDKIKLVIAQRLEDVLASDWEFTKLKNVKRIYENGLRPLDEHAVKNLIDLYQMGVRGDVIKAIQRYNGHPYAVTAALSLLLNKNIPPEDLPTDPTGIAESQWKQISKDENAISLLRAYAVLSVAVPREVVVSVAGITDSMFTKLTLGDDYIASLIIRYENGNGTIYHSILSGYILDNLHDDAAKPYHESACETYRNMLQKNKHVALSALRLPEHVRAINGNNAFVMCLADECTERLHKSGLYFDNMRLCNEAIGIAGSESDKAVLYENTAHSLRAIGKHDEAEKNYQLAIELYGKQSDSLGVARGYRYLGKIFSTRNDHNKAEEYLKKAFELYNNPTTHDDPEGFANVCTSIGQEYIKKKDFLNATEMFNKALGIAERIGKQEIQKEVQATAYNGLGHICRLESKLDEAKEKLELALILNTENDKTYGIALNKRHLGHVYLLRREYDKAFEMFTQALEKDKEIGRIESMAFDYRDFGSFHKGKGHFDKASEFYTSSIELFRIIGSEMEARKVENLLSILNK